jgi:hypothetical protein
MKTYFIFYLFLFFLSTINGYILLSEELGRECKIDFKKSELFIEIDKNICKELEYSELNLFKFNNCESFKKYIKKGIELWSKNNDNIKINYKKNNNTKQIKIEVKFKNLIDTTVAKAYRTCDKKKLIEGEIWINKKKCYYPDNLFCVYNDFLFIIFFVLGTVFHSLYFIIMIDILKLKEIGKIGIGIIIITLIDFGLLIYILINCNKCTSMKNIIGHEMGHILGFGHPDKNYYLNWNGYIKNCLVKKKINMNFDLNSIMLSNSNILREIKSISKNDKLGLYDLYPSCNYSSNIYTNFENINTENKNGLLIILLYIIIPIIIVSIIVIYIKKKENVRVNAF